jgi:hypothetical protein
LGGAFPFVRNPWREQESMKVELIPQEFRTLACFIRTQKVDVLCTVSSRNIFSQSRVRLGLRKWACRWRNATKPYSSSCSTINVANTIPEPQRTNTHCALFCFERLRCSSKAPSTCRCIGIPIGKIGNLSPDPSWKGTLSFGGLASQR